MDRREVLRRELAANAKWGLKSSHEIGEISCRDIEVETTPSSEIQPGEEYYQVSVDGETGSITVTGFDSEGNELGSRSL